MLDRFSATRKGRTWTNHHRRIHRAQPEPAVTISATGELSLSSSQLPCQRAHHLARVRSYWLQNAQAAMLPPLTTSLGPGRSVRPQLPTKSVSLRFHGNPVQTANFARERDPVISRPAWQLTQCQEHPRTKPEVPPQPCCVLHRDQSCQSWGVKKPWQT